MKTLTLAMASIIVPACYVAQPEGKAKNYVAQPEGKAKNLAGEIEEGCKECKHLRFELEPDPRNEKGKNITLNMRVDKAELEECDLKTVVVCTQGSSKQVKLGDPDNEDQHDGNGKSTKRTVDYSKGVAGIYMTSAVEQGDKQSRLYIECHKSEKPRVKLAIYEEGAKNQTSWGLKKWLYGNRLTELIDDDIGIELMDGIERSAHSKAGKFLPPLQDGKCFPKSK